MASFERQGHGPQAGEGGQPSQVWRTFGEEGLDGDRGPWRGQGDAGGASGLGRGEQHLSRLPGPEHGSLQGGAFDIGLVGDRDQRGAGSGRFHRSGRPGLFTGAAQGDGVADQSVGGPGVARRPAGSA